MDLGIQCGKCSYNFIILLCVIIYGIQLSSHAEDYVQTGQWGKDCCLENSSISLYRCHSLGWASLFSHPFPLTCLSHSSSSRNCIKLLLGCVIFLSSSALYIIFPNAFENSKSNAGYCISLKEYWKFSKCSGFSFDCLLRRSCYCVTSAETSWLLLSKQGIWWYRGIPSAHFWVDQKG